MKNKVVIFIDIIAPKNELHIDAILNSGLEPAFFVTKFNEHSDNYLKQKGEQISLQKNFFNRLGQVNNFFRKNKKNIHHAEIHPGGRFSFLYILLAKKYHLKCICVERGDLLYYHKEGYGFLTRFSMRLCYKYSDVVWYREPYMKAILEKLNKKLFFLHNSVKIHPDPGNEQEKDITFLWLNRVIPERKYEWFIEVLQNPAFEKTNNSLVGIDRNSIYKKEQDYILNNQAENLTVADYTDVTGLFYKRAKFFVLPAEVVFANHSLLEAMSYGVVPLVSDQLGSDLIVENEKNGFIFKHTKKDFEEAALKAIHLNHEEYSRLSHAAREKIKNQFSEEQYYNRLQQLYALL